MTKSGTVEIYNYNLPYLFWGVALFIVSVASFFLFFHELNVLIAHGLGDDLGLSYFLVISFLGILFICGYGILSVLKCKETVIIPGKKKK